MEFRGYKKTCRMDKAVPVSQEERFVLMPKMLNRFFATWLQVEFRR